MIYLFKNNMIHNDDEIIRNQNAKFVELATFDMGLILNVIYSHKLFSTQNLLFFFLSVDVFPFNRFRNFIISLTEAISTPHIWSKGILTRFLAELISVLFHPLSIKFFSLIKNKSLTIKTTT